MNPNTRIPNQMCSHPLGRGRIIIPGGARPSVLMTGNSPNFYFLSAFVCSFEVDYGKTLHDLDLLVWDILSCPYA